MSDPFVRRGFLRAWLISARTNSSLRMECQPGSPTDRAIWANSLQLWLRSEDAVIGNSAWTQTDFKERAGNLSILHEPVRPRGTRRQVARTEIAAPVSAALSPVLPPRSA